MSQLSVFEFGEQLLAANDLDPVYVALHNARSHIDRPQLLRWLLAYWCFYHCGTASVLSEYPEKNLIEYPERYFFDSLVIAASTSKFPRCKERRHFRGQAAINSAAWLRSKGIDYLFKPLLGQQQTAEQAMRWVQSWVGFGPWIAFKAVDMLERLGLAPIHFDVDTIRLFDSPRAGAEIMRQQYGGPSQGTVAWAVDTLLKRLGHVLAPPQYERGLGVQEAETVLCKWKSYLSGHYRIGEDVEGLRQSLLQPLSRTGQIMLKGGDCLWHAAG